MRRASRQAFGCPRYPRPPAAPHPCGERGDAAVADEGTPRLNLPYLAAGQAQKHVTLNEALARLDACVAASARSRTTAAQPAEPAEGDLYLLPGGASGEAWE